MNVGTILLAILVFGVLIFVHELGHFIAAKRAGVRVIEFALGMGPVLLKRVSGETQYSLRLVPIGGFCMMEGEDEDNYEPRSFNNASLPRRIAIMVAGSLMNLLLGLLIIAFLTTQQPALASNVVSDFKEGAISNSQLQVGDQILKINNRRISTSDDITYAFSRNRDGVMDILVLREGQEILLQGVTFQVYELGEGVEGIYRDFWVAPLEKTFFRVIQHTVSGTTLYIKEVWGTVVDLVTGRYNLKVLSGPVGVTTLIGEASTRGLDWLLNIIAFITINLGVFNLLPLPALDGGRLLFLFLEAVRRKPINPRYEGMVHAIGFALLMGLVIFATFNDIGRLF